MRCIAFGIVVVAAVTVTPATELAVFSAGAVEPGIVRLIEQYERDTGHVVRVAFGTGPELTAKLAAGQSADVLIAPAAVMDLADKQGKVVAGTRATVGRVGVGIVVRTGARQSEIRTIDALKAALLAADSVIYNQGSSGQHIERLFSQMGVAEQLASRALRLTNGAAVLTRIINGTGHEVGFGALSEIKVYESQGLRLVGPLPEPAQNYTTYLAAVMAGRSESTLGAHFIRFITTPAAKQVFASVGVE